MTRKSSSWARRALAAISSVALMATLFVATPAQAGSSTFYLNVKKGCYSFTNPAEDGYAIEGTRYKIMFRTDCAQDHHVQVIYVGNIKTKNGATATETQVYKLCASYYKKLIKVNPPTSITDAIPYIGYFWPDAGLETLKYTNKVVCYLHHADDQYEAYQLIAGEYK
jgi:hypothetical protein